MPGEKKRNYFSVELDFLNVAYLDVAYFTKDTSMLTATYLDSFDVSKKTYSFNLRGEYKYL